MNEKKQFVLNLTASIVVFIANLGISFFLTPYVLEKLGTEAYGFIGLINNFVSYISVVTVALNSLAGRYITLAYHSKNLRRAREYMSSVFFANLILSGIIFVLSIFITWNIASVMNVPDYLLGDVKLSLALAFFNVCISLLSVVFSVAAFIKNKLYYNSMGSVASTIIRVLVIGGGFLILTPHIWYYTLASVIASVIAFGIQWYITKKLTPELKIEKQLFCLNKIFEIIKSGVWLSLESLNKILQTGLDLLISNIFVNGIATGILSVSKTVPNVLLQIPSLIANIFNPKLAKLYAENKTGQLVERFLFTIRFLTFSMIVPLMGFIILGYDFYRLWLSSRTEGEIWQIYITSILTILPLLFNAYVEGLYYANTLTNKIRGSVIISFVFSFGSICTELWLLKFVSWNSLYIIAGTSAAFMSIRHLLVTPFYCAWVLDIPKWTFYPALFKAILMSTVIGGVFMLIHALLPISSWIELFTCSIICAVVGYAVAFFGSFTDVEKKEIINLFKSKLKL